MDAAEGASVATFKQYSMYCIIDLFAALRLGQMLQTDPMLGQTGNALLPYTVDRQQAPTGQL